MVRLANEEALVTAAQQGDLDAFNRLVLAYQNQAFGVALRIIGDPEAANDAAQEAFISAYRNLLRFKGGNFRAWLLRITTNACYDELRRRKRRPATSLDEIENPNPRPDAEANIELVNRPTDPDVSLERDELASAIKRCLSALPIHQRTAVVLCDIEGYDYEAIASVMHTALGTVKSRIARARATLRDCLRSLPEELLPETLRLTNRNV